MSHVRAGTTIVRTCLECGSEFPYTVKGPGRHPDYCPADAKERIKRKRAERRREIYDPWLWENTILEWNE
jgi:hypothetical protein